MYGWAAITLMVAAYCFPERPKARNPSIEADGTGETNPPARKKGSKSLLTMRRAFASITTESQSYRACRRDRPYAVSSIVRSDPVAPVKTPRRRHRRDCAPFRASEE